MNDCARRIAIDSDSAAQTLKTELLAHLRSQEVAVTDVEYLASHPGVEYPDIAFNLAHSVRGGEFDRGILLCGTGLGMAICANKVPGIYAGTCHDVYSAERLRRSNAAQIITLGQRVIGVELAKKIVDAWLSAGAVDGRSAKKVERLQELEASEHKAFATPPPAIRAEP
jgi:ribose 5-phosphate isomerase B